MGKKRAQRGPHVHNSLSLREAAEAAEGMSTAEALAAGILCAGNEVLIPPDERDLAAITHRMCRVRCREGDAVSREDAATKGRRYLTEGRLTVHTVTDDQIAATCRRDSAVKYRLRWDLGGWDCTREARTPWCSHVRAPKLVVLIDTHARNRK